MMTRCFIWIVAVLFTALHLYGGYGGDKPYLIYAASALLEGQSLYNDIVDVNPPLIFWLHALGLWLGKFLPLLPATQGILLLTLILGSVAMFLSYRLLCLYVTTEAGKNWALFTGFSIFFFIQSPWFFGEREHLIGLCTLPYFLRLVPGLINTPLPRKFSISIGVLAGIGFCLKPHTLILWIAPFFYYFVARKQVLPLFLYSVETRIIILTGVFYIAAIMFFTPAYLAEVVPMALAAYGKYAHSFMRQADNYLLSLVIFCLCTISMYGLRNTPFRKDLSYLVFLCLAGYIYIFANNGWAYAFVPLYGFLMLGVMFTALATWRMEPATGFGILKIVIGIAALLLYLNASLLTANAAIHTYKYGMPLSEQDTRTLRALEKSLVRADARSFAAYSITFPWFSLASAETRPWEMRYNSLWMMPAIWEKHERGEADNDAAWQTLIGQLTDDLNNRKPDIVFIDLYPGAFIGKPDMPGFLSLFGKNTGFVGAWRAYRLTETIDHCDETGRKGLGLNKLACRYAVYKRSHS